MKLVVIALLLTPAFAQEDFTAVHNEDFARWAHITTLSTSEIHRMWRETSHYENEADDDSSIELVDQTSLAFRKQILMLISAGLPHCVTVAIFSADRAHTKLWQASQGPDDHGFCDNLGIAAEVNVLQEGVITVATAILPDDDNQSRAVVRTYSYRWNGKSYEWLATNDSSKLVRPPAKPSSRDRRSSE
jgi:hypothetical protein